MREQNIFSCFFLISMKNSDVLVMDLNKKQWKTLAELDPPRARPLISTADHTDPP